jgi:predicted alpha/beta superfamily hydrolase
MALLKFRITHLFTLAVGAISVSTSAQEQPAQVITYRIGHYETLYSSELNENRTLFVHLPDDYATSSKRYPLLYILDAEDTHRFIQSIAAITFYSGIRRLPKMIVVGILNSNRIRDLTPRKVKGREQSGGGDLFLEFIVSDLFPHVESRYRSAEYRILFGGSSAGLFTMYALFNRPEMFDAYISSRPVLNSTLHFSWDSDVVSRKVKRLLLERPSLKKVLYLDHGGREDALHSSAPIDRLSDLFESGAPEGFRWQIREMEESGYRSAESLMDGLLYIFKDWRYAADSLYTNGFNGIKRHAQRLSDELGYSVTVADLLEQRDLGMFSHGFLERSEPTEAISLLEIAVVTYPQSWKAYANLGEAYAKSGNTTKAIVNYEISLQLNSENELVEKILKKLKSR